MSDNPKTETPDESVRGPDAAPVPAGPAMSESASPEPWAPETDANRRSDDPEERPRARVARVRPDRVKDRHVNARPAKDKAGDAPLRRRPAAVAAPPVEAAAAVDASTEAAPAEVEAPEVQAPEVQAPEVQASEPAAPAEGGFEGERIAKAIARAGLASRRDAEAMIAQGRVTLNGAVLDSPAINVTESDRIVVDGEPLPARERTRLWIFHKPRGLVTTARDPEGRQTVFDELPEELPRVVAIGRLDINTEGLLLLTNDGGLAKVIAHPDTGWLRRYRVRAWGDTTQAELDKLRKGLTIDGMEYGPIEANLDRMQGDNLWLTLGLREGKNREVKRILEHLGLSVNRLIRLSFGPFQLGDLEVGLVEEVRTKVLKEQLGKGLSEQAGVDFESPVREPIAPFGAPKKADKKADASAPERAARPRRDEAPRGGRFSGGAARPAAPERVPTGGMGSGPRRSVWRADEGSDAPRPARVPRRGADPKAERAAAAAERGRERVGAITTGERRVVVERLAASPAVEPAPEPQRRPRYAARDDALPRQSRPEGRPDRAAVPRGERPFKPRFDDGPRGAPAFRGGDGDRPRESRGYQGERREGGRPQGDRPQGDRPHGGRPRGDRPGGARPAGSRFGGESSGGDRREGGYKGRSGEGGYKGRSEGGQERTGAGGRPGGAKFGAKPGGFGGKPGGFGAKPGGRPGGGKPGGFGARPGGSRPAGAGAKPGGFKPGGGRPPRGAR